MPIRYRALLWKKNGKLEHKSERERGPDTLVAGLPEDVLAEVLLDAVEHVLLVPGQARVLLTHGSRGQLRLSARIRFDTSAGIDVLPKA